MRLEKANGGWFVEGQINVWVRDGKRMDWK